jgi:hypothetical protein
MKRSAQLKSLRDSLRHALECFRKAHRKPGGATAAFVTSVDYLLRSAAEHEGRRKTFLAYAYWQEWHDELGGAAGNAKEFRMGAEKMEENVAASLCEAMPETWDDDQDGVAR